MMTGLQDSRTSTLRGHRMKGPYDLRTTVFQDYRIKGLQDSRTTELNEKALQNNRTTWFKNYRLQDFMITELQDRFKDYRLKRLQNQGLQDYRITGLLVSVGECIKKVNDLFKDSGSMLTIVFTSLNKRYTQPPPPHTPRPLLTSICMMPNPLQFSFHFHIFFSHKNNYLILAAACSARRCPWNFKTLRKFEI